MAKLDTLGPDGEPQRRPRLQAESIWDLMHREMPLLPCWIGPALLPKGGKLLLGGEAKIGKTFLCMELCRAIATGTHLYYSPDVPAAERAKVLLVDQEVGIAGLRKRALSMLAKEQADDAQALKENFFYVSKSPGLHLDKSEGLEMISELCEDIRPNVLVLDPASRLLHGEDNDNATVRRFFENIDHLIKRYKDQELSIVVAHHFRKPPLDDLDLDDDSRYDPYNFRGAGEWPGAPDTIQTIVRPARIPGEEFWLLGTQYETRHGMQGERMYLQVEPKSQRAVSQITSEDAHAMLDAMRQAREEAAPPPKSKRRSSRPMATDGGPRFGI